MTGKNNIPILVTLFVVFHVYLNRYVGAIEKDLYFISEYVIAGVLFVLLQRSAKNKINEIIFQGGAFICWGRLAVELFYTYTVTQIDVIVELFTLLIIVAFQIRKLWKMKKEKI